MRRLWLGISGVLFLLGSAAAAVAQTVTVSPDRAGRISYVEGSVSVRGADQEQWSPAGVNWPVTSGTAIWTQPGARAEIQVGPAELRIDQNTELDVTRLDDGITALAVPQGVANIHISAEGGAPIQVDTANGPVTLNRPGFYHVENGVVAAADTSATPFDRWAMARAQQATVVSNDTLRYVSPQTTGYQDLGTYGSWTVTPDYGAIWYPRVVPIGWAPYRYGHWAYVTPWGWTWVDAAPWGFTPFHYGRWVLVHDRWAWWPGQRVVRPVYTPALVVFVGGGGFHDRHRPPARWIPLAPRESVHVNVNVNVVNVDRFANRHAASSLPRSAFDRDGRPGHDRPGPRTRDHDATASPVSHREGRENSRPNTAGPQRSVPQAVTPSAETTRGDARNTPSDPARRNHGPDRPRPDHRNAVETRAAPLPAAIAPSPPQQKLRARCAARDAAAPQPRAIAPAATPQADAPRPSLTARDAGNLAPQSAGGTPQPARDAHRAADGCAERPPLYGAAADARRGAGAAACGAARGSRSRDAAASARAGGAG